ncbi:MAG TPA: hypothetical protein VKW06_00260 [Candidatus Angelobacter sp.]|nr:hypothetical protein [Candidatus Angelobacter sp.]
MPASEMEKLPTSHDLARALQQTAEWLLSRPSFQIEERFDAMTWQSINFSQKDKFLAAVRAIGTGKKAFRPHEVEVKAEIPGGRIYLKAPRDLVCRLIRPAEYECDPFLSPEEEKQLGGAE